MATNARRLAAPAVGADLRGPGCRGIEVGDGHAVRSGRRDGRLVRREWGTCRRLRACGSSNRAWSRAHQPLHFLLRQGPAEVRHRPARAEDARLATLRRDEHELALLQSADRCIERVDVGAACGRAKALEHACLVVLGLQPTDEPGAGVRHRLVVEVDRVLGREDEPEPERATLLEDRQDRLLRRRRRRRRNIARDLVHVGERAKVGRAGLAPHPRHELREDERRHEHPLLVGEMCEVDDRGSRLALRA